MIAVNPSANTVTVPFAFDVKEVVYSIGNAKFTSGKITLDGQSYYLVKI